MSQSRQRFPVLFKRKAVDQVLAATPLCHVAETLGIAEMPIGQSSLDHRRTQALEITMQ
ncbi:TPA: hypothetical protein ACKRQ2_001600 [Pseudomonas aeruginosa]|uniref:hypothetical protein n=1 Tax=Pseudomonas aeruginosa TaxID=287 RepID=UPI00163AC53B|nr:hypothetical protein [Pseudomonas aeruginosa]EIU2600593.1 hypothetical protein [Pseudomonas aeruginosa]EIU2882190.1 hypothetical protein [Pseudomonas aeruginosa]EKX2037141.1 hypothetical protein [Pseudomonas aeruginosa]ELK4868913.1 hypothetical protein [Pseudomonas aeruginosa]MBN5473768.1 hypothetical protein [Pseudomonas aeruginosa]